MKEVDLLDLVERESISALRLNTKMADLVSKFALELPNNASERVNNRPFRKQPKSTPPITIPMSLGQINIRVFEIFGGQSHYRAFVEGHGMEVILPTGQDSKEFEMRTKYIGVNYVAINHNGEPIDEETSYFYEKILDIMGVQYSILANEATAQ